MADGVLTAAVSVTSAVGGIGKLLTMPVSQACWVCLNSHHQALHVEGCGFHLYCVPYSLPSTLHVSPLAGLFGYPLSLTTAWHCMAVYRFRTWLASFICFFTLFLISLTIAGSYLHLAAPYRSVRHSQHHKVSWHLSCFWSIVCRYV